MNLPPPATTPATRAPSSARRPVRLVLALVMLIHVAALYWPSVGIQGPVTWSDKVVHVLLFLVPTVLGLLAGFPPTWVVALLAVHAPVSELVQHFLLPHRSGDLWDAVADLSGVLLGVLLVVVGRARRRW